MPRQARPPLLIAVLIGVGIVVAQALLVPLFAGPAANLGPRDLPVVVAGPAPAADALAAHLPPGAFEVTRVPDAAAADALLRDNQAYAAFVLSPSGTAVHTASGASPTVAQLVGQAAAGMNAQVTDVVPGSPDDPRGAGFASGFLPFALTALAAGAALALLVRDRWARFTGVLVFGVLAGLVGPLVLQQWLGVLTGDYLLNAAAIGLFATAVAGFVAGLGSLLGRPGIALGVLTVFLVGNPLSAVSAAPELLPQPWGAIGQYLPIGAGGSLLRSTAFFDGAGAAGPAWVLGTYAVVGLLLALVGGLRTRRTAPVTEPADRVAVAA
ncbi:hypothetical protein SAMN05421684_3118 [Asanoa ishikariensis]|uniref:ABC-2 family transporter protein n=1 Tax=Asanoa ishikariensis TaxID=137265 RepID=A0A1H3QR84_9ACTN|nr:hypothetical protein [Asanoa ishikariensis]SDZ15936.1 hypothetical protein SAMN05421684_3118 [Asanoa ishikariensis]